VTTARLLLFLFVASCGRSELVAECRVGEQLDTGGEAVVACPIDPAACVPTGEEVVVATRSTAAPAIAYADGVVLDLAFDACGAVLSAVTVDGRVRWTRRLGAVGDIGGALAFDRQRGEGVVTAGTSAWAIASDGMPDASFALDAPALAALASEKGPALVSAGAYTPLATRERIAFDDDGGAAVHVARDAADRARFFTSSTRSDAVLWDVASGGPTRRDDVFGTIGPVVAAAEFEGEVFTLSVFDDEEFPRPILWLKSWGVIEGGGRGDVFVDTPSIDATHIALLTLGDTLMAISPHIDPAARLAFAIVDVTTQPETLGEVVPISVDTEVLYGPAATVTPRGFAVTWTERDRATENATTRVRMVTCCAP
jgi:hypothetical protein